MFDRGFEACPPGNDPKRGSWWLGDFVPLTVEDQNWTAAPTSCRMTTAGAGKVFGRAT